MGIEFPLEKGWVMKKGNKLILRMVMLAGAFFLMTGLRINASAEYRAKGAKFDYEGNTYEVTKPYDGTNYGRCKLQKVNHYWHSGGQLMTSIGLNAVINSSNGSETEYYFQDELAEGLFKNNVELEIIYININHSHTYSGIPLSAEKNVIPKNCFSGCKYLEEVQITSGYNEKYPKGAKKLTFEKNVFNKCSADLFIRFINIGAKNIKVKKGALGKGTYKRPITINCTDHMQKTLNSNADRKKIAKMFKKSGTKRKIRYINKTHNGLSYKTV